MQSSSLFDVNTFLETHHTANLDPTYHIPDEGDYLAQLQPDMTATSGVNDGRRWTFLNFLWEIIDDNVKRALNLDRVQVRQSVRLDIVPNSTPWQTDLGINKSMALKALYKVAGLLDGKHGKGTINPRMLVHMSALVHVSHRPDPKDPEIVYAEVTRVTSPDRARGAK